MSTTKSQPERVDDATLRCENHGRLGCKDGLPDFSEPPKRRCAECGEVKWHKISCSFDASKGGDIGTSPVLDSERVPELVPKCARLEGCHELEGALSEMFIHDAKCPKSAPQKDEAADLIDHKFVPQYRLGNEFCAFPVGLHQCLKPRSAHKDLGVGFNCPIHGGRYETYCTLCPAAPTSAQEVGEPDYGSPRRENEQSKADADAELTAFSPAGPEPLTSNERFQLTRAIKDFLFGCKHERDRAYDWCPTCVVGFMESTCELPGRAIPTPTEPSGIKALRECLTYAKQELQTQAEWWELEATDVNMLCVGPDEVRAYRARAEQAKGMISDIEKVSGGANYEPTVEQCLSELREMFPDGACSIESVHRSGFGSPPDNESEVYEQSITIWVNSMSRGKGTSLAEAIAAAREFKAKEKQ